MTDHRLVTRWLASIERSTVPTTVEIRAAARAGLIQKKHEQDSYESISAWRLTDAGQAHAKESEGQP